MHEAQSRSDKTVIALAALGKTSSPKSIQSELLKLGVPQAKKWNMSAVLTQCGKQTIRTTAGWELTPSGKATLETYQAKHSSPKTLKAATEPLRKAMESLTNQDLRTFIEEAIHCIDHGLLKASVVFTWVGAIAVLQEYVVKHHLVAMNADIKAINSDWKPAKNADGLGLMKEATFLDALARIGVIGKNVKTELKVCLDLRNGCGHPNSLKIGEAKVISHVETLVLNVFQQFGT